MEVTATQQTKVLGTARKLWQSTGQWIVVLGLGLWLVLEFRALVTRIYAYYTPVPSWDYWRVVFNFPDYYANRWGVLWRQHNEHRIVFPELIFAVDALTLHMRQVLPLVASGLTYAGTFGVLAWAVVRDSRLTWFQRLSTIIVSGLVVFWEGAAVSLGVPFLLQWPITQLAVATSLLALAALTKSPDRRWLTVLVIAGTVATYSSGNGLLLWPLLVGLAVLFRITRYNVLVIGLAAAINIGAYFIGYQRSESANLANALGSGLRLLGFVASYVSVPLGWLDSPNALTFGCFVLLSSVIAFVASFRGRIWREGAAIVLWGNIAFTVITALVTAVGRMTPDPTFGAAKAARYLSVGQMNWGAVFLFVLWCSARLNPQIFPVMLALAALFSAHYLPRLQPGLRAEGNRSLEIVLATSSLENGVTDASLTKQVIFPDLNQIRRALPILEKYRLSFYAFGRSRWPGQPAKSYAPIKSTLPGSIVQAFPTGAGIQVVGWADDTELRKPYRYVMLVDDEGKIRGSGRRFALQMPGSIDMPELPRRLTWAAYLPATMSGKNIRAYAVDERGKGLLPLADVFRIPDVLTVHLVTKQSAAGKVSWNSIPRLDPGLNLVPSKPADIPPGKVYSTWQGADALTGEWQSGAFPRPANGCVVIPVLTGPKVASLQAGLEDASSGRVLEQFPLRNDQSDWTYWQVKVGANEAQQLRIHITDQGKDWGEWLAAADPLVCPQ